MTLIVNMYGGPGTGKSTTAAGLFAEFKRQGVNAELVREYVKSWAWEGRKIEPLDQFYIFGKQLRAEACLLDKVDVVVTDSPILLGVYFSRHFGHEDIATALLRSCETYWQRLEQAGHQVQHWLLERRKAYNPAGRYQTEEQARAMDSQIHLLVHEHATIGRLFEVDTETPYDKMASLARLCT